MHNEECHLVFCLFYPNYKLTMGCNFILEIRVRKYKGRAATVDLLAVINCVQDI